MSRDAVVTQHSTNHRSCRATCKIAIYIYPRNQAPAPHLGATSHISLITAVSVTPNVWIMGTAAVTTSAIAWTLTQVVKSLAAIFPSTRKMHVSATPTAGRKSRVAAQIGPASAPTMYV